MIEIIFTRPMTIYNSSEPTNRAVFSKAKPLRTHSPRLVQLRVHSTLTRNVATHRKVFVPFLFITFDRKMISFFRFSLKLRSFLSVFFFKFSIMCRKVFNKTIILLGLAGYEMIITNSALRASLVIYHFISSAPS